MHTATRMDRVGITMMRRMKPISIMNIAITILRLAYMHVMRML